LVKRSGKPLIIVESPTKARTISRAFGRAYRVEASLGHLRDLPRSQLGVDIDQDFEPKYITVRGRGGIVKDLRLAAQKARKILLAADPDREGEAISWHLAHLLGIDPTTPCRIEFHEITKEAVAEAIRRPRAIDMNLVNAQQARRVLDRLVGYGLSPLLWQKVRRGLSAGRVQSVAVRLICEREAEIEAFVPREYWTITAALSRAGETEPVFEARFAGRAGEGGKVEKVELGSRADRHENLWEGRLGRSGLRLFLGHTAFRRVPFVLEVPGFAGHGPDVRNIRRARLMRREILRREILPPNAQEHAAPRGAS